MDFQREINLVTDVDILYKYLSKAFLKYFLLILSVIAFTVYTTSLIDILTRYKDTYLSFSDINNLALFKLPYLLQESSSFIIFIATFIFLNKLVRENELAIYQNAGISFKYILLIPIILSFLIGIIITLNPLSSIGFKKHQKLEMKLRKESNLMYLASSGLLLREDIESQFYIIHIKSFADPNFQNINFIINNSENEFMMRIFAKKGILTEHKWILKDVAFLDANNKFKKSDHYELPSSLTFNKIINNFSHPEFISFWSLPKFADKIKASGLSPSKYLYYFYKLLAKPLVLVLMTIMASCFTNFNMRKRSNILLLTALICCFISHFLLELFSNLFLANGVGEFYSIFIPLIMFILFYLFILLEFYQF